MIVVRASVVWMSQDESELSQGSGEILSGYMRGKRQFGVT